MNRRTVIGIVIALIVGAILVFYTLLDPSKYTWMPQCMFLKLTGLRCPACGAQRALYACLHGNIGQAVGYNPILVISIPYLLLVVWTSYDRRATAQKWRTYIQHRYVIYAFLAIIIAWWIVRNILDM